MSRHSAATIRHGVGGGVRWLVPPSRPLGRHMMGWRSVPFNVAAVVTAPRCSTVYRLFSLADDFDEADPPASSSVVGSTLLLRRENRTLAATSIVTSPSVDASGALGPSSPIIMESSEVLEYRRSCTCAFREPLRRSTLNLSDVSMHALTQALSKATRLKNLREAEDAVDEIRWRLHLRRWRVTETRLPKARLPLTAFTNLRRKTAAPVFLLSDMDGDLQRRRNVSDQRAASSSPWQGYRRPEDCEYRSDMVVEWWNALSQLHTSLKLPMDAIAALTRAALSAAAVLPPEAAGDLLWSLALRDDVQHPALCATLVDVIVTSLHGNLSLLRDHEQQKHASKEKSAPSTPPPLISIDDISRCLGALSRLRIAIPSSSADVLIEALDVVLRRRLRSSGSGRDRGASGLPGDAASPGASSPPGVSALGLSNQFFTGLEWLKFVPHTLLHDAMFDTLAEVIPTVSKTLLFTTVSGYLVSPKAEALATRLSHSVLARAKVLVASGQCDLFDMVMLQDNWNHVFPSSTWAPLIASVWRTSAKIRTTAATSSTPPSSPARGRMDDRFLRGVISLLSLTPARLGSATIATMSALALARGSFAGGAQCSNEVVTTLECATFCLAVACLDAATALATKWVRENDGRDVARRERSDGGATPGHIESRAAGLGVSLPGPLRRALEQGVALGIISHVVGGRAAAVAEGGVESHYAVRMEIDGAVLEKLSSLLPKAGEEIRQHSDPSSHHHHQQPQSQCDADWLGVLTWLKAQVDHDRKIDEHHKDQRARGGNGADSNHNRRRRRRWLKRRAVPSTPPPPSPSSEKSQDEHHNARNHHVSVVFYDSGWARELV